MTERLAVGISRSPWLVRITRLSLALTLLLIGSGGKFFQLSREIQKGS
jgi:hypothetical protein